MTRPPCGRCCSAPLYPLAYWMLAASAALRSETVALVRGPREQRVVWDIPRGAGGRRSGAARAQLSGRLGPRPQTATGGPFSA